MSRATAVGTVMGGLGGLVAGAVAALQFFSPGQIKTPSDLIESLKGIEAAIIENGLSLDELTPEEQAQVAASFQPISTQLARNLSELSDEQFKMIGNVTDLAPGQTGEFRLPSGGLVDVSFVRWRYSDGSLAVITYEGQGIQAEVGWRAKPASSECDLIFVGPVGEDRARARFRLRC